MTLPRLAFNAILAQGRPLLQDLTQRQPQQVEYSYWPVYYIHGDPTVISQTPLPLSGVQYSRGIRSVGQLTATLQLADAVVRSVNPWATVIPRKTGIVVVRTATDPTTGARTPKVMDHFIVWSAPADPATGRMTITANTVESAWARRMITGTVAIRSTITPGKSYTWSAVYFTGASFSVVMECDWFNGGTFLSKTQVVLSPGTGTHTLTSTHTAPAGANAVQPSIFINPLSIGSGFNLQQFFFGEAGGANFIGNALVIGGNLDGWTALNETTMVANAAGGSGNLSFVGLVSTSTSDSTGIIVAQSITNNAVVSSPVAWQNVDQQQIAADLLNPAKWSQVPVNDGNFPGWITIDPPTVPTHVIISAFDYQLNAQTSLLQAHQDRSNLDNGYEWFTEVRVLDGVDAGAANAYRVGFVLGYPRTGRQVANGDAVPTFTSRQDGTGNVVSYKQAYDGSAVANIVWGQGSGFQSSAVQALAVDSGQWDVGFLQTERQYQNTTISDQGTLQAYTNAQITLDLANEQYVTSLIVRGDLPPTLDTWDLGDDALFYADDWIWPDDANGNPAASFLTRILGYVVTPPEGNKSEQVQVLMSGGDLGALSG